jgi:putative transposase
MFVRMNGRRMYLWRAADDEGEMLDVLVQSRRDKQAALKLMRKLLRRHGRPQVVVTARLGSHGSALRQLDIAHLHETDQWQNNRAEVSHQAVRKRERQWLRFRSPGSTQRSLATHAAVDNLFNVQRHLNLAENAPAVPIGSLRAMAGDYIRCCLNPCRFGASSTLCRLT